MIVKRFVLTLCSAVAFSTVATGSFAGAGSGGHDHTHVPGPSVAIGAVEVGGNVSVVMGLDGFAGGNVGVLSGPDGLLIVDDMLAGFEHKLENVLSTLKTCADCGTLKYLINTHWHFDHTGNNDHFGGGAVLVTHDTVRPLFQKEHNIEAINLIVPEKTRDGLPDITFAQNASIYFNDEEIELTHFPKSHTSGDVVVFFKGSNVIHMGDLYFNGMFPFIDLDSGGNVKGMIRSAEAALKRYPADAKVIPGHGPVSDMKGLRSYLDMLKQTTEVVEAAKKAGKSLEETQKQGLDERWASWAWSFVSTETWIALIYNSL